MRRFILALGVVMLALVIACGGGDDDDSNGDDGNGGGGGNDNGSYSSGGSSSGGGSSNSGGSGGNSGGGSNSNFCSTDTFDNFDDLDFTNTSNLKDQFEAIDDGLEDWADNAPDEIEDDINLVVDAMRDLIQVLRDNDFNILALATSGDDPFTALDTAEFNAATERIGDYCGFDFDSPGGSIPGGNSGGSTGGGSSSGGSTGGGFVTGSLPDDYPSEIIPPDSEVGAVIDLGFGLTVEFMSTATIDEIKDYYEAELGNATFADSESILWIATLDEKTANVSVNGTDGNLTVVIILADAP